MKKRRLAILLSVVMAATLFSGCGKESEKTEKESEDSVQEISLLMDTDATRSGIDAVVALAEEKIGVKVNIETRPGGPDGENLVKTRLASGDMADICLFNSGALLEGLNPQQYFVDLSGEDFAERLDDGFITAASVDGKLYGVPFSSSQVYGIVYSKDMYEKYGLEVPKTWDEFLANCDVLKENGETAILGSYSDLWTTQIAFLGDAYNLQKENPDFAQKFTDGEAKWKDTPEALRSFEKLAETVPYYNEDYLSTTYNDACDIMANGKAGHWFILTQALSNIYDLYGDSVNNLGVFPVPSDSADINGMTMYYPSGLYANKNSENIDAVLKFLEFYISDEALDAYTSAVLPDGPYCVKGYEMPEEAYTAVREDIQKYFDEGATLPALEYVSPVKGSNCAAICQELGSGQTTASEAAEKYDDDCYKKATQLGLSW